MSEFREWKSGIVNRNYHILHNLLEKDQINKIFAVDFLPYTKKRALKILMRSILKSPGGKRIHFDLTSRLTKISDKLYVYSTIDSIFSEQKVYKKINKLINKYDLFNNLTVKQSNNLLVWSYFPMFSGYFNYFKNSKINSQKFEKEFECVSVFDTVDNWMEHPNFTNYKDRIKNNYEIISKESDYIFTVSKDLLNIFPNAKNKEWIPNGVDLEHFNKKSDKTIIHAGHPIIGYVGTIEKRLDFELIKYLSLKNPEKSIVLIGPVWKNAQVDELKSQNNIHFLGRKSYSELPYYINEFDVCIIPHKIDKFTKSMNPLKLYEYLACGKPIVTTKVSGIEKFQELIYTAKTKEEFNEKISQALSENSKEKIESRKNAVQDENWKNRVNQMLETISK
jgi:glycosyltransferase involved in cell wall biosynthesis